MDEVLMYTPRLDVNVDTATENLLELQFHYQHNGLSHQLTFYLEPARAREWGLRLLTKSKQAARKAGHG